MMIAALALLAAAPAHAQSSGRRSLDGARMVCRMFDTFSSTTQPCEYSIWNASITVYLNMSPVGAKDACSLVPIIKQKLQVQFEEGWTLRFHTSFTGNNALATCKL